MDESALRAVAKEGYIYGYPMVDSYRVQCEYFEDRCNPEFKAPWNELLNGPRVYTAEDRAIVSPNSDTPYSLTVPPIEAERYFSVQLIDAYTHNFDYIGSRATGNGDGRVQAGYRVQPLSAFLGEPAPPPASRRGSSSP